MKIYTSYYANVKKLNNAGIVPVAISVGIPWYFKGASIPYLAPRREMLKMSEEEYIVNYNKILEKIDLDVLRKDLNIISKTNGNKDIALLCYEKSGDFCHRRLFANWLEKKTGYFVEEFGYKGELLRKENNEVQGTLF